MMNHRSEKNNSKIIIFKKRQESFSEIIEVHSASVIISELRDFSFSDSPLSPVTFSAKTNAYHYISP